MSSSTSSSDTTATPDDSADAMAADNTITLLGEVLDLLAGIEARQKVLAKEIAAIKAFLYNQDRGEVIEELRTSFAENLERERNDILNRVSVISTFPNEKSGDA
jgi:hypothetical protein